MAIKCIFVFIISCISLLQPLEASAQDIQSARITGSDRFEVAVNISKKGWHQNADTVIISNHLAYADALSASPLAYKLNAPILLTQPYRLTDTTKKEIRRLNPTKIIIIGGTGSISHKVETELKSLTSSVERLSGKDRFEVAYKISKKLSNNGQAIIAYGLNFPDALAIAPYAAKEEIPILLTLSTKLPSFTEKALEEKNVQNTLIVGGKSSISPKVEKFLPDPKRIDGENRFEVASNVIRKLNLSTDKAFLSTGLTFADALTGSVLAAKQNAPMLLTFTDRLPTEIKEVVYERKMKDITILGGPGSVSNSVLDIPHHWEISKPSGPALQGYTSSTSAFPGEILDLYVHSTQPYKMELFRMGYYGGEGAEIVHTIKDLPASKQVMKTDPGTMQANWKSTFSLRIDESWKSGVYMAKLTNKDQKSSYLTFVVKDKNPNASIGVLISTNTYNAYNNWGGKSLYGYNSTNKEAAVKVSFDRPYNNGRGSGEFFAYEYNMIRWLEKKGYKLTYFTDTDVDNGYLSKLQTELLLIPGHDEYWTKAMRDNIQRETKARMNLAVFNANVAYWQVRLHHNDRLMVGYKYRAKEDPFLKINPSEVTTRFRDMPVNRPEKQVMGLMYAGIPEKKQQSLVVSNSSHWIYNGTGLKEGDKIEGVIGGEVDRYDGQMSGVQVIADSPVGLYGKDTSAHVIFYNKPTGGKVFATGTFYWNWFLDPFGHETLAQQNEHIEQMTINVLTELTGK